MNLPIIFCSRAYFSDLRSLSNKNKYLFKKPWNFRPRIHGLNSLPEKLCSRFLRPEKIHRVQPLTDSILNHIDIIHIKMWYTGWVIIRSGILVDYKNKMAKGTTMKPMLFERANSKVLLCVQLCTVTSESIRTPSCFEFE